MISTVFFDILRDKDYGFKIEDPLPTLVLHVEGCGFVDDSDIIQLGLNDDDYWVVESKF